MGGKAAETCVWCVDGRFPPAGMRNVSGASRWYSPNLVPTRMSVRSYHRNRSKVSSCSTLKVLTRAISSAVAS